LLALRPGFFTMIIREWVDVELIPAWKIRMWCWRMSWKLLRTIEKIWYLTFKRKIKIFSNPCVYIHSMASVPCKVLLFLRIISFDITNMTV
jgi:hypothetical protein